MLVTDRAGQAIDLRLGGDVEFLAFAKAEKAAHAGEELDHVLLVEGVVEREHGHGVHDLAELAGGRHADALGRRIGPLQCREAGLDREVAAAERVVVRVRNGGRVLEKVVPVVLGNLGGKPRELALGLRLAELLDRF